MSDDQKGNPDILVKRTRLTRKGAPCRMVSPITTAGEEWLVANAGLHARVAASFVVPKKVVEDLVAGATRAGLDARSMLRAKGEVSG